LATAGTFPTTHILLTALISGALATGLARALATIGAFAINVITI